MESIKLHINLTLEQLLKAVKQLSPLDKLKVNDAIWDESSEIPAEHQELVNKRINLAKANPERLLDWDNVLKTL